MTQAKDPSPRLQPAHRNTRIAWNGFQCQEMKSPQTYHFKLRQCLWLRHRHLKDFLSHSLPPIPISSFFLIVQGAEERYVATNTFRSS